jgi:hypothetical protein
MLNTTKFCRGGVNSSKVLVARFKMVPLENERPIEGLHDKLYHNNPSMIGPRSDTPIKESKPGDSAPFAYTGKKNFPDWYKPYLVNYYGHGYLIAVFALISYAGYIQYQQTLKLRGRRSMVTYRNEQKYTNGVFFTTKVLNKNIVENTKIPLYNYTRRYIKESGF